MKCTPSAAVSSRWLAVAGGFLIALTGAETAAATFPDYPLQTGTGSIPPNVMFILDDSGSMTRVTMPREVDGDYPEDNPRGRSYVNNKLYYDPRVDYRSWMQSNGERMSGGLTYGSAYAHFSLAEGPINLANNESCYRSSQNSTNRWVCGGEQSYYVPMSGIDSPGTTDSNYHKYIIRTDLTVVRCERVSGSWGNCVQATPTGRTPEAERNNYATWFSYHRTRMKVAKAGASEAFSQLGQNFRVGYDSIWNRRGSSSVSGNVPAYRIPVGSNDGLFTGDNKETWFSHLFNAQGAGNTPLHGALQRAGDYFETDKGMDGPWGPEAGDAQLSCRQNFAILTTDGYWNNYSAYTEVGDSDGSSGVEIVSVDGERTYTYEPERPFTDTRNLASSRADTLADVAMHYWKRDLRDDLANNVPSSASNPAFWQNMSTFGISIGLQGTISPDDVIRIEGGEIDWPNPLTNSGQERIDDLLHAAVNGRGSFVAATNPQEFADALKESLAAISRRRASGSNVASNGPSLNNGSHLFQATYTSGEWSGDVVGISIVGGSIAGTPSWSMATVANEDPSEFSSRPVYTWHTTGTSGSGASFPTNAQTTALIRNPGRPDEVAGDTNANYIKGSRAGEGSSDGALRRRVSPVGDIVNSSPFYVPETDNLFIGANDGMLHGINAADGTTLFSYVPKGLDFSKLAMLSSQDYTHHFFVDGGIDVTTRAQGRDRNILVASLGRGGKGVFALDVTQTDPAQISSSIVRWDRTFQKSGDADYHADIGHVLGAPLVRQGNNGKTIAIVPNGIDSANGKAVLFIYVLNDDGSIDATLRIPTNADGTAAVPNGLSEARAADVNADGKADYVYAGDLYGNLWKFDISSQNTSQWDVAYRQGNNRYPIFTATDPSNNRQPITAAVALAKHPGTGQIYVMFGTGSYVSNGDLTSTRVQTLYSIIDDQPYPITKAQLQQRTIPITGVDSLGRAARAWEPYSELDEDARGWYVNLGVPSPASDGERVVTAPFVRGRALWFSSIIPIPGEGCDAGGTGYLNAVDAFTGTNPRPGGGGTGTFIDVNQDGVGNDQIAGSDTSGEAGFITSVDLGIGMPSQGIGVGNAIYACGSDATCGRVPTPPASGGPARLFWHERVGR